MARRMKKTRRVPSKLRLRLAGVLLVTTTALPLGACTPSRAGPSGPFDTPAPGGALITVDNQNAQSMRVYLVRGGTPILLGSVDTLERRTFSVPTSMLGHSGTLRLAVHALGSTSTFLSPLIPAAPGDLVEWRLAHELRLSSFAVRRVGG